MNQEEYISLYEKYIAGQCSEQEEELLLKYHDQFDLKEHVWEKGMGDREEVRADIYNRLQQNMRPGKKYSFSKILTWSAAASVAVMLFAGLYTMRRQPADIVSVKKKVSVNDIKPGSNKATLTLADGSVIELDNNTQGLVTNHDGVNVQQTQKGQLVYEAGANTADNAPIINTISTPIGGQYKIILQDGTKVWLNAASSLRFPAVFNGNERLVEITGEVYFEVAKNAGRPFKVNFNGNTITVLGTHFNVMAYADENKSKVTLLEGAVNLENTTGNTMLKPGMQAVVGHQNGEITARRVNVEEAVAWKNGYFLFDNENIQSIMRKLSRWYNIDVSYDGNMQGKEFSGSISKFENVSEVLDMLELTESIHFNLEGRRIKVKH